MTSTNTPGYEAQPSLGSQLLTWANLATTVRLVLGLAAFCVALVQRDDTWNFIGLAIYWSLDIVDGQLARRLNQETLFGAQYDILADRIQVAFFYLVYGAMHPEKIVVITLFLLQFMVFDHYLSNQFIRWRILSPNYFYRVDQRVFDLLWSPLGKALNTGMVTILILLFSSIWPAMIATLALIGVRAYCMARVMTLPAPCLPAPPQEQARARADEPGMGEHAGTLASPASESGA
ncbi:CDP-alcohol phosphatidyltransferase family protein [Haliangium sp.]|uniref:CDP-alcohol phosphatidyltransferase family protein n=1 Tax=Haliangium sp. TaxID=2663208 RepID=UPI003D0BB2B7